MNQEALQQVIEFYKCNYAMIEKHELYKWKALKCFQENWNIENEDFCDMLKKSLAKTYNLMSAGNYFPSKSIVWMAEKEPEYVRGMFRDLFSLSKDLRGRIEQFRKSAIYMIEKYKEKNVNQHFQDDRAIMVYLSMRYPDKYYLYKYEMFKEFVSRVNYCAKPKRGDSNNPFLFHAMCEWIQNAVVHDEELCTMYEARKQEYGDEEYHLLVQDIVFAIYYLKMPELLIETKLVTPKKYEKMAVNVKPILQGNHIDYVEKEKYNTKIGNLGEQFVYNQERERVNKYKLPKTKQVEWTAKEQGDGLGYDILSYDEKGNPKYIEVKTTTGKEDATYYVTANELLKSQIEKDNYFLYRVYEFDVNTGTGELSIRQGALDELCISPVLYQVDTEVQE